MNLELLTKIYDWIHRNVDDKLNPEDSDELRDILAELACELSLK